ncbi:tyrosine-protein phosphatase [Nocardia sp. NPDC058379]|uniref:tyrosine-protein phosphatase n=1 Tax=unclassified Nocardia TaxID=2637762 RepID=UPI003659A0E3
MRTGENTVFERELPLRCAVNARDLGGLRTEDGRRVRPRLVLRSDLVAELGPDDRAFLVDDCALRTVIDLRGADEIGTDGRGALADVVAGYHNAHVYGASRTRLDLTEVAPGDTMFGRYREYLEHSAHSIVAALDLLTTPAHLPALIHCAAGKDRTGVVVAILLALLDVRADDIVADYAATAPNVPALRARRDSTAPLPDWIFAADADTMRRFLSHLTTEHGGAHAWAARAGLDESAQRQLATILLEDAQSH